MLREEDDWELVELQSKDDERMLSQLQAGDFEAWRIDEPEYCASMAKRLGWGSLDRLQEACQRVLNGLEGLRVIAQDRKLPLAHELTTIEVKVWKAQAMNVFLAAEKCGVHVPRAVDILRRYKSVMAA